MVRTRPVSEPNIFSAQVGQDLASSDQSPGAKHTSPPSFGGDTNSEGKSGDWLVKLDLKVHTSQSEWIQGTDIS